jgi:hypothetical protein
MARPPPPAPAKGTPDQRFRGPIQAAIAEGAGTEDLVLRLTLSDTIAMSRDKTTPLADISYAGGVMRFLGVRVIKGGVGASVLERAAAE